MDRRVRGICALDRADRHVAAPGGEALVIRRRRFRAGGSRVLHVRLAQSRRGLLCRARSFRHHPRYAEEHCVRCRPALLRRRVRLARHGRRRGAAERFQAIERLAAQRVRAGADRRLGVPRAAQSAGGVGGGVGSTPSRLRARRKPHPNLSRERSLAFSPSVFRSRARACGCSDARRPVAEAVTSATARSKAGALACEGLLKPESLRTNCSAEAWISSSVAGGSKLNSVLMLRHIFSLFSTGLAAT